jgi:hypothetical protein
MGLHELLSEFVEEPWNTLTSSCSARRWAVVGRLDAKVCALGDATPAGVCGARQQQALLPPQQQPHRQ